MALYSTDLRKDINYDHRVKVTEYLQNCQVFIMEFVSGYMFDFYTDIKIEKINSVFLNFVSCLIELLICIYRKIFLLCIRCYLS